MGVVTIVVLAALLGTIVSNVVAGQPWHANLGRNTRIGAVLGVVSLIPALFGVTGAIVAGIIAIGSTIAANLLNGQRWDKALLATLALTGALMWGGGKVLPPNQPTGPQTRPGVVVDAPDVPATQPGVVVDGPDGPLTGPGGVVDGPDAPMTGPRDGPEAGAVAPEAGDAVGDGIEDGPDTVADAPELPRPSQQLLADVDRLQEILGVDPEVANQLQNLREAIEDLQAGVDRGEIHFLKEDVELAKLQKEAELFGQWAQADDLRWLRGVELASPEVLAWITRQDTSYGRLKFEPITRKHERWFEWQQDKTNAEMTPRNPRILHRENPRRNELLEEVLHHAQDEIPNFDAQFPYPVYELHVKDFMIRHREQLGITPDEARILQQMMHDQMDSLIDNTGRPLVLPESAEILIEDGPPRTGPDPLLELSLDDIRQMMQDEIDDGLDLTRPR